MSDTFDQSLIHWSEAGRAGMDAFYALATADYRVLAETHNWADWLCAAEARATRPLRLLDVACGSGKFPDALVRYAAVGQANLSPIAYSLLDPSAFSIMEARNVLKPPFIAAEEYECTLQGLDAARNAFDVVWATHALYAVPPDEIDTAMARFIDVCGDHGFIAHAAEHSHYVVFDRLYRTTLCKKRRTPYTTAEDILASLERLGAKLDHRDVSYVTKAPAESRAVEGFLQRCVFDDTHSLAEMLCDSAVGPYLAGCRSADGWHFEQTVKLIFVRA